MNRKVLPLTFRHWAGVSPYTSAFALAETCVFGKQFRGLFSCGPLALSAIELPKKCSVSTKKIRLNIRYINVILTNFSVELLLKQISLNASGQSLFRSYGRFFAEFLNEGSLVGLSLLDSSTGVGLRYGRQQLKLVSFSSQGLPQNRHPEG